MKITKEFNFDMGHRLPNHNGKCKNIHGHSYKLQMTISGSIRDIKGDSDEGMVLDFGEVKFIVKTFIDDMLDHYFMAYEGDVELVDFIKRQGYDLTVVDFIPTAENIVMWIYQQLSSLFKELGVSIENIKLWETPTSFAELGF